MQTGLVWYLILTVFNGIKIFFCRGKVRAGDSNLNIPDDDEVVQVTKFQQQARLRVVSTDLICSKKFVFIQWSILGRSNALYL